VPRAELPAASGMDYLARKGGFGWRPDHASRRPVAVMTGGRGKRSTSVCGPALELAPQIDRQTASLVSVKAEQCGSGFDRRRLARPLYGTEQLHLLAADQWGGPPPQVGIFRRLRLRPAVVPLDDESALTELDIA
jgi:hypothetical protein